MVSEQGERRGGAGRRMLATGVAIVAVVGAAGAGYAAGSLVGGGGTQPEDVLPASTVAFADVDLDPAAEQKVNVVRLLGRLPDVENDYGPEPDLRTLILDTVARGTPLEDAAVDEWIGDRMGVGLVWDERAASVTPVVALQTSDPDAAVDDLSSRFDDAQVAVLDGYVLVTGASPSADTELMDHQLLGTGRFDVARARTQSAAEVGSAAEVASLGDSPAFDQAFAHLDDGIASFYLDGTGVADMVQRLGPAAESPNRSVDSLADSGQSAAVLRAEPDAIELAGWSSAPLPQTAGPASLSVGLPGDTVLAIEGTGGSEVVSDRWRALTDAAAAEGFGDVTLDRSLAEVEARLGIRLPDDLETLAGDDAVLAVDGTSMLTGIPGIGIASVTDPDAGADLAQRLQQSLATLTGGFGFVAEGTDDGMVLATSTDYAKALTSADGDLGRSERFQRALPDVADASYLAWVDLAAVTGPLLLAAPDAADALAPLDSFGITVGADDGGTAVRARLVFAEDVS